MILCDHVITESEFCRDCGEPVYSSEPDFSADIVERIASADLGNWTQVGHLLYEAGDVIKRLRKQGEVHPANDICDRLIAVDFSDALYVAMLVHEAVETIQMLRATLRGEEC